MVTKKHENAQAVTYFYLETLLNRFCSVDLTWNSVSKKSASCHFQFGPGNWHDMFYVDNSMLCLTGPSVPGLFPSLDLPLLLFLPCQTPTLELQSACHDKRNYVIFLRVVPRKRNAGKKGTKSLFLVPERAEWWCVSGGKRDRE